MQSDGEKFFETCSSIKTTRSFEAGSEFNANIVQFLTSPMVVSESRASFHNSTLELKINFTKVPVDGSHIDKYLIKCLG